MTTVDARPITAPGAEPFDTIRSAVAALADGEELVAPAPFEPVPLEGVPLEGVPGSQGFRDLAPEHAAPHGQACPPRRLSPDRAQGGGRAEDPAVSTAERIQEDKKTMISDQPLRGRSEPATDPLRTVTEAAGSGEPGDGGDPACWACLVCEECGAVISEGHRAGCSHSLQPGGPLQAGA